MAWTYPPPGGSDAVAQAAADAAQADATTAIADAATAQGVADTALADAATAQSDATSALTRLPHYAVMPSEWADASGLFVAVGSRLELRAVPSFENAADFKATPGPGWTLLNSGVVVSGDHGVTTPGALTVVNDGTATVWGTSTRTAANYMRDRVARVMPGRRMFAVGRLAVSGASGAEQGPYLAAYAASSPGTFLRIGITNPSEGVYQAAGRYNTSGALTAAITQAAGWFAWEMDESQLRAYYVDSASATEPARSAWVQLYTATSNLVAGDSVKIGFLFPGANFTATAAKFRTGIVRDAWDGARQLDWGCEDFSTSGYVLSRQITVPAAATITDAALRAALVSAVVTSADEDIPGTGWTARAKRGGAPSGAYAALASVAQEATTGADLYVDMKFTSDGVTRGALAPVLVRGA